MTGWNTHSSRCAHHSIRSNHNIIRFGYWSICLENSCSRSRQGRSRRVYLSNRYSHFYSRRSRYIHRFSCFIIRNALICRRKSKINGIFVHRTTCKMFCNMLYYNLKPIMKLRGISHPYSFLVNAGFSPKIAQKISGGTMRSLRMSHVERLCLALMCEPNDLLAWKPNPEG
ncbi:MAG TPA: hypothetical protein DEG28_10170, partial [Porphyromonadaceae bacterium]|nr:hypothetical protein [Porphyromonadaceae bacterium]